MKVMILGAGASAAYGYPVAARFQSELRNLGEQLGTDAARVKKALLDTVQLLEAHNLQTLDDLAFRLLQGTLDNEEPNSIQRESRRWERVYDAKIATSACFLSLEAKARTTDLRGYKNLILEHIGPGRDLRHKLRDAQCRILTFNYDRLFETALTQMYNLDGRHLLYGEDLLNSGLNHAFGETLGFSEKHFCFLKLHGCAGLRMREDYGKPAYDTYSDLVGRYQAVTVNDGLFFSGDPARTMLEKSEPLIVFPWEKDFVLTPGNDSALPFRDYIPSVWRQAEKTMAGASEIWFIGYSFASMDIRWTINLLKCVKPGTRVYVQNLPGEAERLCDMLKTKYATLGLDFVPYASPF